MIRNCSLSGPLGRVNPKMRQTLTLAQRSVFSFQRAPGLPNGPAVARIDRAESSLARSECSVDTRERPRSDSRIPAVPERNGSSWFVRVWSTVRFWGVIVRIDQGRVKCWH